MFRTFGGFLHVPTTQINCFTGAIISETHIIIITINNTTRSSTSPFYFKQGFSCLLLILKVSENPLISSDSAAANWHGFWIFQQIANPLIYHAVRVYASDPVLIINSPTENARQLTYLCRNKKNTHFYYIFTDFSQGCNVNFRNFMDGDKETFLKFIFRRVM